MVANEWDAMEQLHAERCDEACSSMRSQRIEEELPSWEPASSTKNGGQTLAPYGLSPLQDWGRHQGYAQENR
jgi:hypothetical protein